MYAEGDGVARDDYEAFKFFSEIAQQDVEPGSPEESYVSDALVALGGYMKRAFPARPVAANAVAAQEYYMRAAANYRNPTAQFEMGKMFLAGDGGVKASVRQAGRWFQLAAEKGHAGAQATLGNLLFQSGKIVRGLAHDDGRARAGQPDRPALDPSMQEEAFSLADEADRRTAIALADDILAKGHDDAPPATARGKGGPAPARSGGGPQGGGRGAGPWWRRAAITYPDQQFSVASRSKI